MAADDAVDCGFADNGLHVVFALAAGDLSDELLVNQIDLCENSDDQELMVAWSIAGLASDDLGFIFRKVDFLVLDVVNQRTIKEKSYRM